uniref:Stomagen C-terminal domain-containing protein n=1 Tax=Leersia perrieri TaxID=77586 RepID=A0A0D9X9Z6_9ORYZ
MKDNVQAQIGRSSSGEEQETPGGGISRPATERRMVIGSRAPTCTYNECRGCRHRCSVQEVPVDAGDPMNSAYHYRCICHI